MTRGLQLLGATLALVALLIVWLILAAPAYAGGGNYEFDGGGPRARAQVTAALEASSFPWDVVPVRVTIHLRKGVAPQASPGHIWLDPYLVVTGRWSWAVIQHEYAHQVAYFVPGATERRVLQVLLGGRAWCYEVAELGHDQHACERFAHALTAAYWPSRSNLARHELGRAPGGELRRFREIVRNVLGIQPERVALPAFR